MRVGVHKLPMNSPNDVSALVRLIDAGEVNPSEIVALIGKTEGNGGANDFTRGFATLSYSLALAPRLGVSPDEVAKRIAFGLAPMPLSSRERPLPQRAENALRSGSQSLATSRPRKLEP